MLITPLAPVPQPAVPGFAAIAAAQNEQLDRGFLLRLVVDTLQPMIKPAQSPIVERQRRFRREFDFARNRAPLGTMRPRADDQLLRRLLGLGEGLPVQHVLPA